ncbi:MAG TPA: citrate synthase/methylcitrate synthase [Stellaceae bacterium]|nr:citrate synthase/methylcitrate synthase [Stellaceae bacterium]
MNSGLEGIVAAETALSHVDGEAGELVIRGWRIEELAGRRSFEGMLSLLWTGLAPGWNDEADPRRVLGRARERAFAIAEPLFPALPDLAPVERLRLLLSALGDGEETPHPLLAVAAMPVFIAGLERLRQGAAPVAPDPRLSQAADFLRMLRGASASAAHVQALDTYLVTVADHGLNASTFAARIIASTRAGLFSAVIGALCALKGPLHGGAPGPVLDMLDAIGTAENIEPWLTGALAEKRRLMGFGHRVYRTRDPRADILKRVVIGLRGEGNRIRFAEAVEAVALRLLAARRQGRSLDTNVEFYTALLLEALGLPRAVFTSVFAMGRVAGWTAHILEQEREGRLIRPLSAYTGPAAGAA